MRTRVGFYLRQTSNVEKREGELEIIANSERGRRIVEKDIGADGKPVLSRSSAVLRIRAVNVVVLGTLD